MLKKLFSKFKYIPVKTIKCRVYWTDAKYEDSCTVIFLRNGFGWIKTETIGSIWPANVKEHRNYQYTLAELKYGINKEDL